MLISNLSNKFRYKNVGRYLYLAAAVASLVIAGFLGYSWYTKNYEQHAYKNLAEHIDAFAKLANEKTQQSQWEAFVQACNSSAQKYSRSALYPYFLAYKAQALIQLDKRDEALAVMNDMLKVLDKKQSLYPLYDLKRVLIKLDTSHDNLRQEALQELAHVAQDNKSPVQDMALYYQGLENIAQNNTQEAEKVFKELMQKAGQESAWYHMAQEKLKTL